MEQAGTSPPSPSPSGAEATSETALAARDSSRAHGVIERDAGGRAELRLDAGAHRGSELAESHGPRKDSMQARSQGPAARRSPPTAPPPPHLPLIRSGRPFAELNPGRRSLRWAPYTWPPRRGRWRLERAARVPA